MEQKTAEDSDDDKLLDKIMSPKEKIFFIPSEYLTMGLVALFIFLVLGGIIFIAAKTASDSSNTSIPLASATSDLFTPAPANIVPSVTPPQPPTGPVKPKTTATPKPTATPTPKPTTTPTPGPTATPSSDKVVNLSMDPASATKNTNDTFGVDLKMDTGSDQVAAAEIHLSFDKDKLEVQSFTAGSFLSATLVAPTYDNSAGTASVSLGSGPTTVNGTGTLATITFKAKASGTGSVSYSSNTQTSSSNRTGNTLNNSSGATITIN